MPWFCFALGMWRKRWSDLLFPIRKAIVIKKKRKKKNVKSSAIMLKTGCLNKHPEVRTNSSSDWSQRYSIHWHLAIRAGKWRWSGTWAQNVSVISVSFISCLSLLKKPRTFILKALFEWRSYICPLYVSPIQTFVHICTSTAPEQQYGMVLDF